MSQTDPEPHPEQEELWRVAHRLADLARPITLAPFRSGALDISNKDEAGFDPVTQADRAAETAMRAALAELRPRDGILGEEFGAKTGTSGLTWVLDPIDGTRAYLSGTPTWGVLIALSDASGPRLGIIDQPFTAERFAGGFGRATLTGPHGDAALSTRATASLSEAILFTTFPEVGTPAERAGFDAVARSVRLTRYGMDCYAYGLLAAGQIDLVIEAGLQAYDIAAPIAVIEAAGGLVSNWQGGAAAGGGRVLAAANPQVHAAALDLLRQVP
jgi:histidinol phosphatase-like enzyme (inositol monophosphatase family)